MRGFRISFLLYILLSFSYCLVVITTLFEDNVNELSRRSIIRATDLNHVRGVQGKPGGSYEERLKAFRKANNITPKNNPQPQVRKNPRTKKRGPPVVTSPKSDATQSTPSAWAQSTRIGPVDYKRLTKFNSFYNITNLTNPTDPVYGDYDQCSSQSLTKYADTNITRQNIMHDIHRNLTQRFTSLNYNASLYRCFQRQPPWDKGCPGALQLMHVPKMLKEGKTHQAVMSLEYLAKMLLGEDNEDPKILQYPRIEYYLWQLARMTLTPTAKFIKPEKVKRVLHVATELFNTGGHTKVMQSFIHSDKSDREHSVFIRGLECRTIQCIRFNGLYPMLFSFLPKERLYTCRAFSGDRIIHCSQVLRNLTASFDLVVLHIHQFDTVPILALGDGYHGPPVVLFDHSDHTFWLGSTVLDSRLSHRQAALRLAHRRGIEAHRNFLFHYPISNIASLNSAEQKTFTKAEAKAKLGIREDQIMLLSMASSYKFHPLLLELVTPVLAMFPDVMYIAIGPNDWNEHPDKFSSVKDQVSFRPSDGGGFDSYLHHIAADIHIDSFPFTSLTSALESVREEGIALSFCPWQSTDDLILCIEPDDFAAPSAVFTCPSASAFTKKLAYLVASPERLLALQRYGAIAMRQHDMAEWTFAMDKLYTQLLNVDRRPPLIDHSQDLYDVKEYNIA
jgi:hypothetical protein